MSMIQLSLFRLKKAVILRKSMQNRLEMMSLPRVKLNYWNFKPIEDNDGTVVGTKVTHIICNKPNGSIPDIVVNKMLGR